MASLLAILIAIPAMADSAFLKPSEAFQVHVDVPKKQVIWDIADGTYLYEQRVKVSLAEDKSVSIPFHFLTTAEEKDDPNFAEKNKKNLQSRSDPP